MNINAVRILTKGTPASASPIPARPDWTTAATTTPSATGSNRLSSEMHHVLASRSGKPPGEPVGAAGRRLAVRVQNGSNDHREQELDEQQPDTAHLGHEPEGGGMGDGRQAGGDLVRTGCRELLPARQEPRPDHGDRLQPGGGLRAGESGHRS